MTDIKKLARIFSEEAEALYFGDIDPLWFEIIANEYNPDMYSEEDIEYAQSLETLLERVSNQYLSEKL